MSKILVIHPDLGTCGRVSTLLAAAKHEPSMCQDGRSALEALKNFEPEFVLVNDELPNLESFKLFKEIRKAHPTTRVLMLSLKSGGLEGEAAMRFGIPDCTPEEIPKIIEALERGRGVALGGPDRPKTRIVSIDDDPEVRDLLKLTLQADGYEVSMAADGEEGLKLVKEIKPQLVLLDIDMPKMNGVETLKRIREFDKKTGVVMITADSTLDSMALCGDHGAFDYMVKPFDLDYLRFCIYSKALLASL